MRRTIYIAISILALVSCTKENFGVSGDSSEIRLSAAMNTARVDYTKGSASGTAGVVNSSTDSTLTMGLVRIDQNKDTYYPLFKHVSDTPIVATLGTPDADNNYRRPISFSSSQFFRNTNDEVRFAGWSPWNPGTSGYSFTAGADSTLVTIPIDGQTDILYGVPVTGSKAAEFEPMQLKHALCVYRISVYAMEGEKQAMDINGNFLYDDNGEPIMEKYDCATLWGDLTGLELLNMANSCTLRLPIDSTSQYRLSYSGDVATAPYNGTYSFDFTASNKYYWKPTELPSGFDNKIHVATCIGAPPAAGFLRLGLTTELSSGEKEISIARNFKPGYMYDIVLRFSDHGVVNASITVSEWTEGVSFTQEQGVNVFVNLSRYGSANCYQVNSGNYNYSFDTSVKGNGDNSLCGGNASLSPDHFGILWTDFDNSDNYLKLFSEKPSGNLCLFTVGDADDKVNHALSKEGNAIIAAYDASDNIIWTWHIWLTDRVKEQGLGNGYAMMDRNLGAIAVSESKSGMTGLWYQWGRPTPLQSSHTTSSSQVSSVDEAVASPTVMVGVGNSDWLSAGNDKLWGFQNDYTDIKKTMYDPCPVGYQVADQYVGNFNVNTFEVSYDTENGANVFLLGHNLWFPTVGYYDGSNTFTADGQCYIWTGSVSSGATHFAYTASKTIEVSDNVSRSAAVQVRCVATSNDAVIVKNLSGSQTANCYIVSGDGYYKFDATVRGNGLGTLFPIGGSTTWEIRADLNEEISPEYVDLLWWQGDFSEYDTWQSAPGDCQCVSLVNGGVPDSDGFVTFKVSDFHKGNLILAAYDNSKSILWTWHIWLTDKPGENDNGNYSLMDRYLGATYVPDVSGSSVSFTDDNQRWATYGFIYQWGRKDPFPGAEVSSSGTASDASSSPWFVYDGSSWTRKTSLDVYGSYSYPTMAQAAAAPMYFYPSSTRSGSTGEWYSSSFITGTANKALWGYAVVGTNMGKSFSKTMFDPCPPGYRTMYHQSCYSDNGETGTTDDSSWTECENSEGTFNSYGIVYNKDGYDRAWWPFNGYRNYLGIMQSVGTRSQAHTGMPYAAVNVRSFGLKKESSTYYTTQQTGYFSTSTGMSVRCMKE